MSKGTAIQGRGGQKVEGYQFKHFQQRRLERLLLISSIRIPL